MKPHLPAVAAALFRSLLPYAERQEVLADLEAEHAQRVARDGRISARLWLWRQLLGSLPALLRRSWWRGWTGFEPRANRMRPGGPMLESWIMDGRYAARRLVSRPTYTLLAVLTLALGAGGTAAVFSVVRTLLLDPLPIAAEEQVGVFWFDGSWNEREITTFRPNFPGFQRVGGWKPGDATLQIPGEALRMVRGVTVTSEIFDVLGARAALGRTLQAGEDVQGAEPAVVLSHALWQDLGGDPNIVGRQLLLAGTPRTVTGVMPRGFWFPSPETKVWIAAALNPQRGVGEWALIGRVDQGQRVENMQGPLAALAKSLGERFRYPPQWDKTKAPAITPVREYLVGDVRPGLLATFAAMALILLIACGNVATLMLGQVGGRSTEFAVRTALGAERRRLAQQLLIEALIIGVLAGFAGTAFAAAGFGVLVRSLPLGALAETAALDWTLLWVSILVGLLAALGIAAVSATALWRGNTQSALATTRTGGISVRGGRLEGGLVVAQIALAVLLAAGAGLLLRSVANLRGIDPGVDVDGVAVLDVTAPMQLTPDERRRAYLAVLPSLQSLPGVKAAAATQKLPLRGNGSNWGVRVQGRPDLDGTTTFVRVVTPDYFTALGIPISQGRGFVPTDLSTTDRVVVVNEALAAKFFPGQDPVNQVLNSGFDARGERIIGVVENVAEGDLTDAPAPARYMLYEDVGPLIMPSTTLVLRTGSAADVPAVIQAARTVMLRDAPQLAIDKATTMQTVFDQAVGPAGQVVTLVSLLAILALLLGAIGVYGVISHFVARRSRDYGVCMALGLPPTRVLLQVVRRGVALVGLGSVVGILAAYALTGALSRLLYGVGAADPLALTGAVITLLLVGVLAAVVPARRASLTDPAVVLRQQ